MRAALVKALRRRISSFGIFSTVYEIQFLGSNFGIISSVGSLEVEFLGMFTLFKISSTWEPHKARMIPQSGLIDVLDNLVGVGISECGIH